MIGAVMSHPIPTVSAEHKLTAIVARPDGWQRAFSKRTRRSLSGATASSSFLMPNERTTVDNAARIARRDTIRHDWTS